MDIIVPATFLGPMIGFIGAWKLGVIDLSPRAWRRLILALVAIVILGVIAAAVVGAA
jgi:hypothetical protein